MRRLLKECVHGILIPADLERVKELFTKYDDDHSGGLNQEEFKSLMYDLCGEKHLKAPKDKDLARAFCDHDQDDSGTLDLAESTLLYAKLRKGHLKGLSSTAPKGQTLVHGALTPADLELLKRLFEKADADQSGVVDRSEFKSLIKTLCSEDEEKPPKDRDLDAAFKQADVDGGGGLDLDEVAALYASIKKGEIKGLGGGMFGSIFGSGKPKASTNSSSNASSPSKSKPKRPAGADEDDGTLVHGVLTPAHIAHLRQLFQEADQDSSGHIDMQEFRVLIKKLAVIDGDDHKVPKKSALNKAFKAADVDGGGTLQIEEITLLYAKVKKNEIKGGGFFGSWSEGWWF